MSSLAFAQISEFDEPPTAANPHRAARPAPSEEGAEPASDATTKLPQSYTAPTLTDRPAPAANSAPITSSGERGTEFPYIIRPGDSLGSIAAIFGLDADTVAHSNHLSPDAILMVGRTLKIPNPFAAQVRSLSAQLDAARTTAATADERVAAATLKARDASDKIESLTADNDELRRETVALPRWRGSAVTLGIVALLMFGVMMVTLFEWWLLRRRFAMLVEITDSLTNLDQKYKGIVAKAELRFQQLYGRRRVPGSGAQERGKSAEEIEIERLNHDLREALEQQLNRLGVARARPGRGGRWREIFGDVEPPVEARSLRR